MDYYFDYVFCCVNVPHDVLMDCCGGTCTLDGDEVVSKVYLGNDIERSYLSKKLGISLPDADYYKLVLVK